MIINGFDVQKLKEVENSIVIIEEAVDLLFTQNQKIEELLDGGRVDQENNTLLKDI
jgi:hypothetical protein